MKNKKPILRGACITKDFASKFKTSKFYTDIYCKHKDEIIVGIRSDYINLYYNCDSIAKISANKKELEAEISKYYLNEEKGYHKLSPEKLCDNYKLIKEQSDKRHKLEKQAQERLVIDNNKNEHSNWYCFDVEYKKAFANLSSRDIGGRFDIMAISKDYPHKVALIELKYGASAIGGDSGIRKHVEDFSLFSGKDSKGNSFFAQLKPEIVSILNKLELLGIDIPASLKGIKKEDISDAPLFYFITLNNNPLEGSTNTPKSSMSGYLFNDHRWGCKRLSKVVKQADYFELTKNSKNFHPIFLFSKAQLPDLGIKDIIDDVLYEKELV